MRWPNPICIHISSPISPSTGGGGGLREKVGGSGGGWFEFFWGVNNSGVTSLSPANSDQREKVNLPRVLLLRGRSGETYLGGGSDQWARDTATAANGLDVAALSRAAATATHSAALRTRLRLELTPPLMPQGLFLFWKIRIIKTMLKPPPSGEHR